MEGTTSYGGTCSACRIDLRSSKAVALSPVLCLTGVGQIQKFWPPSLLCFPALPTMTFQKPVPTAISHEPPSPDPFLDSPAFASAWLFGKGNKRLKLVKGERPWGHGIPFPRGDAGFLCALLVPPPTPSHTAHLGSSSLSPLCLSHPPTQDGRVEGRLPRDGGGERRLPMSLRLEGFPDLLRAEREANKRTMHYIILVYISLHLS